MWMLSAVVFPMLTGAVLLFWKPTPRMRQFYVMTAACITAALSLLSIFSGWNKDPLILLQLSSHLVIAFHVDGLTAVFGTMVSLLWPLASLYAIEYMSHEDEEDRFFALYLASFGVTLGIAFSASLIGKLL